MHEYRILNCVDIFINKTEKYLRYFHLILYKTGIFIIMIQEEKAIYTLSACSKQLTKSLLLIRVVTSGRDYQTILNQSAESNYL